MAQIGQLPIGIFDEGGKFEPKQEFIDAARAKALEEGKKYIGDATGFEKFKDALFDIPDATIALVSGTAETLSEFALGLAKETLKGAQLSTTADSDKIKEIRESPGFTSYFDQLNFPRSNIYDSKISGVTPTDVAEFTGKYVAPVPAGVLAAGARSVAVPAGRGIAQLADDIVKSFTRGDSGFRASAGGGKMSVKDFQNVIDAKGSKTKVLEVGNEATEGTFKYKGETYNKSDGVLLGYTVKRADRDEASVNPVWRPKESILKTKTESSSVKTLETREIEKILRENFSNDEMLNISLPRLTSFLESKGIVFKSKTPEITHMKLSKIREDLTGQTVGKGGKGIDRIPLDQKLMREPTSSLVKEFDEAGQIAITNFRDDLLKLTGFNKSMDDSIKVAGPINRFLNGAVRALKKGDTTADEIIEQLNKVDKNALADVLKKNANIRNKLKKANELGIDLDDLNLSHMEDVADNWKTSLDANNLFLATKDANQKIQIKLDKDIKKLFTNFREAKTLSEKKELVKQFKNIKKELIDNDLVSVIDGKKIGADVDFEKTFKKFSEKADAAILERLFKKDGGIMSIDEIIQPISLKYTS